MKSIEESYWDTNTKQVDLTVDHNTFTHLSSVPGADTGDATPLKEG